MGLFNKDNNEKLKNRMRNYYVENGVYEESSICHFSYLYGINYRTKKITKKDNGVLLTKNYLYIADFKMNLENAKQFYINVGFFEHNEYGTVERINFYHYKKDRYYFKSKDINEPDSEETETTVIIVDAPFARVFEYVLAKEYEENIL